VVVTGQSFDSLRLELARVDRHGGGRVWGFRMRHYLSIDMQGKLRGRWNREGRATGKACENSVMSVRQIGMYECLVEVVIIVL